MGATWHTARPDPPRVAALAVIAAVVVALVLVAAAIARFPGGSDCDPAARGFDPWCNYLSDLLHAAARDGLPNPAAPLARAAMLAFVAALPPFWALVARLLPARGAPARGSGRTSGRTSVGDVVRATGTLSAFGWAGAPLLGSDRFGALHGVFVLLGAGPGLLAAGLTVWALRPARPGLALLGALVFACVGAAVGLYLRLLLGAPGAQSLALPALQKVAGVWLVAWLVAVAATTLRAPPPPAPPAHGPT